LFGRNVALVLSEDRFLVAEVADPYAEAPTPRRVRRGVLPPRWFERLTMVDGRRELGEALSPAVAGSGGVGRGRLAIVLPDRLAAYETRSFPPMDASALRAALERQLRQTSAVPALFGFSAASFRAREKEGKLHVLRYAVTDAPLRGLLDVVRGLGFKPRLVVTQAVARACLYRRRLDGQATGPLAILDLGAEHTAVSFFHGHDLCFQRIIDRGSRHIFGVDGGAGEENGNGADAKDEDAPGRETAVASKAAGRTATAARLAAKAREDAFRYLVDESRRALLYCIRSIGTELEDARLAGLVRDPDATADRLRAELNVGVNLLDPDLPAVDRAAADDESRQDLLAAVSAARMKDFEGTLNVLPPGVVESTPDRRRTVVAALVVLAFAAASAPGHLKLLESRRAAETRAADAAVAVEDARRRLETIRPALERHYGTANEAELRRRLRGEQAPYRDLLEALGRHLPREAVLERLVFAGEELDPQVTLKGYFTLRSPTQVFDARARLAQALLRTGLLTELPTSNDVLGRTELPLGTSRSEFRFGFEVRARLRKPPATAGEGRP